MLEAFPCVTGCGRGSSDFLRFIFDIRRFMWAVVAKREVVGWMDPQKVNPALVTTSKHERSITIWGHWGIRPSNGNTADSCPEP